MVNFSSLHAAANHKASAVRNLHLKITKERAILLFRFAQPRTLETGTRENGKAIKLCRGGEQPAAL
jgi:hypothetical protein